VVLNGGGHQFDEAGGWRWAWATAVRKRSFQSLNERGFTPLAWALAQSERPLWVTASRQCAASAASIILRRGWVA
jgi:hypothetical protein